MALEQLGKKTTEGCVAPGQHVEVVAAGSSVTLTADQSGATVLLDTASGSAVTLPTPVAGMTFDFVVSTTVSSNTHSITSAATTELHGGGVSIHSSTAGNSDHFQPDGSDDDALSMNGTTTGGIAGSVVTFTAESSTSWIVSGTLLGSGTLATPFA